MFEDLFDSRVCVAAGPIEDLDTSVLTEAEAVAIVGAVGKRQREFATGRSLARQAIASLGRQPSEIIAGSDRAPIWPTDIVGSITHTDLLCAVAVARASSGISSIGLDIEEARPLPSELIYEIMEESERQQLSSMDCDGIGLASMVLFSAKEAAYKCQYPLTREFLEFSDFSVSLDASDKTFCARFNRSVGPFVETDCLYGRWQICNGHIATATVIDQAK